MPRSLDVGRLSAFATPEPVAGPERSPDILHGIPWPSREPAIDGQVSIKAPVETIARFRQMCREDRRTYADMLGILMDHFEEGRCG